GGQRQTQGNAPGGFLELPRCFPALTAGKRQSRLSPFYADILGSSRGGLTYRGISYPAHQPSVGAYVDVQQGWLYAWTNFNSLKFSTRPAVEMTMALGVRPVFGAFEFDFGSAYYYYPGEVGLDRSNYWESHATVSHKLTEKLTLGATVTYAPNVWLSGAWGWYAGSSFGLDLPNGLLPSGL